MPLRFLPGLAALFAFSITVEAQYTPLKIVATGETYPGVGTITAFGGPPSQIGGTVSFTAAVGANNGVFTKTGATVSTVALTSQPLPGGGGNFVNFNVNQLGQSASGVGFLANSGSPTVGIYSSVGGTLTDIVRFGASYPGGGTFTGMSIPAIEGTTHVFGGTNGAPNTALGIFSRTGIDPIAIVANTATPVPGGVGNFTSFTDPINGPFLPAISGANIVYGGQGGGRFGVFASLSGTQTAVATNFTAVPGGAGNFTNFQFLPAIDGSTVGFAAASAGRTGIYKWTQGGGVTLVADTLTTAPGGGIFSSFSLGFGPGAPTPISMHSGRIAFAGTVGGPLGVYTDLSGSLARVVRVGDTIDGKMVTALTMSNYALSATNLTLTLRFIDNSQAVYSFTPVPEPGMSGLILTGILILRRRIT